MKDFSGNPRALAIDFGATSLRSAIGELSDGVIQMQVIEQVPHTPVDKGGILFWDFSLFEQFCRSSAQYAECHSCQTLGIDSWGVDYGLVNASGEIVLFPVYYRDPSHVRAFETLREHRRELFQLTGIQHQPFNTIYQLAARRQDHPELAVSRNLQMLTLPDLMGFVLSKTRHWERSHCSTTQLLQPDNRWSEQAFALAGWPVLGGEVGVGDNVISRCVDFRVNWVSVPSHDTASGVVGLGHLGDDGAFLLLGTWSLFGVVVDKPVISKDAEDSLFTNEQTADGRIRFLCNIPGFYVVNRLHEELSIQESIANWLDSASPAYEGVVDLFHEDFFFPPSMELVMRQMASIHPETTDDFAALALNSLAFATQVQIQKLEDLTGRRLFTIHVGGAPSQCAPLCKKIADATGRTVIAGAAEATLMGNLATQFRIQGYVENDAQLDAIIERSSPKVCYFPGEKSLPSH